MRDRFEFDTLLRYARAHHLRCVLIAFAVATACDALFGSVRLHFPFTSGIASDGIPFRRELPLAFAAAAVGALDSPMRSLEEAGSTAFRRLQLAWLAATVSLATALLAVVEFIISPPGLAWLLLRALLIWTGFAMLSGRLFGWRLSWILPLITVFPLTYWEQDASGQDRWWDWTGQPATSLPCWGIAAITLAVGCAALTLTPWRTARLRRLLTSGTLKQASPRRTSSHR